MITEEQVRESLKKVPVPAVTRNIVGMNLVREVAISDNKVKVTLATTGLVADVQDWLKMQVKEIHYNDEFKSQFLKLPKSIHKKACKKEALFRENPFHPSLRLHKLKGKLDGLWSISIDMKHRIIFF